MGVNEQYACTKVLPSSVEITTNLCLQGERNHGTPERFNQVIKAESECTGCLQKQQCQYQNVKSQRQRLLKYRPLLEIRMNLWEMETKGISDI